MLERDGYPAGVPCWVDTAQPDPEAAIAFYGGLFGWSFDDSISSDSPSQYFVARLRKLDVAAVGSVPDGPPSMPVWNTYIWVDSADETAAKVTRAGGRVITPPFDVGQSGRMAVIADPAGAALRVRQAKEHKGAQLVNEPSTWNWSNLNTRSVGGAKAFYAAAFGWQAKPVDFGSGESWMWRVPGYADFLELKNPGVRQRHADAGAPEGSRTRSAG
jgi:predicted enzyme related to lactoylglutathione lyase